MSQEENKYVNYVILPKQEIILCYFEGQIQMQDIIELNKAFMADPTYISSYDVLMDFRNCEALVFRVDILEYIGFFRKTVRLKNKVKSGILINSMNAEFLFKTYKSFISLFNIETEKFYQLDACLLWIKPKPNDYSDIKEALLKIMPAKIK